MSTETFTGNLLAVLDNNKSIGKSILSACTQSGARFLDLTFSRPLSQRGRDAGGYLNSGLSKSSGSVESAMDQVYDRVSKALLIVATKIDGIGTKYAPTALTIARKVALPGAKLANEVTKGIANGVGGVYQGVKSATPPSARRKRAKKSRSTQ